jgi:GNAT superfamily N-acetyltransferase
MMESVGIHIKRVGLEDLAIIEQLNETLFQERRIINRLDRADLTMLIAYLNENPIGFKVGYGLDPKTFYSAKGGILEPYRRHGVARHLLYVMMDHARDLGYRRFAFDTFPNRHAGMTILGLQEGFRVVQADFNTVYNDYRLRFEKKL